MRLRSEDKNHFRKSADQKAQIRNACVPLTDWFVLFDLKIFSGGVHPPDATSRTIFFLFPIVFWISAKMQIFAQVKGRREKERERKRKGKEEEGKEKGKGWGVCDFFVSAKASLPIVFGIRFIFRWEGGRCSRKFDRLFRCFDPLACHLTEAKRRMGTVSKSATFLATEIVSSAPFKRGETKVQFFGKETCKTHRQFQRY